MAGKKKRLTVKQILQSGFGLKKDTKAPTLTDSMNRTRARREGQSGLISPGFIKKVRATRRKKKTR